MTCYYKCWVTVTNYEVQSKTINSVCVEVWWLFLWSCPQHYDIKQLDAGVNFSNNLHVMPKPSHKTSKHVGTVTISSSFWKLFLSFHATLPPHEVTYTRRWQQLALPPESQQFIWQCPLHHNASLLYMHMILLATWLPSSQVSNIVLQ